MTSQIVRKRIFAVLLAGAFVLACFASLVYAMRPAFAAEIYYAEEPSGYRGDLPHVEDSEFVACDSFVIDDAYEVAEAPSYCNGDSETANFCAAASGCNIIGFYDRFFPNLIPGFEPGILLSSGTYRYYPDVGFTAIDDTFEALCDYMEINTTGVGTTEEGFRDGLQEYAEDQGYDLSYTSIYDDATNVNLTALGNATQTNKVGALLLHSYNYVQSIQAVDGGVQITKMNSENAHIMMMYGYIKVRYYTNGILFRTDTFLQVAGGYSDGSKGYIKMEDDLVIEEALIVTIS